MFAQMMRSLFEHALVFLDIIYRFLYSTGLATRYCNGNDDWLTVDASSCISRVFQAINASVCLINRKIITNN